MLCLDVCCTFLFFVFVDGCVKVGRCMLFQMRMQEFVHRI